MYLMRLPEGKYKCFTLSYDDAVKQDLRLMEIMKKNGLKGTFNVNSGLFADEDAIFDKNLIHVRLPKSKVKEYYKDPDFEVAVHGYIHNHWNHVSTAVMTYDIARDKAEIEEMFGKIVIGSASPYGEFNDNVVDVLRNAGIKYSRTVISSENFMMPTDWLRLHPTCHHTDKKLMQLADDFIKLKSEWHSGAKMFYLWGHSYEFDMNNDWDMMENFCSVIGGKDDIWYATNGEIYTYCEAYKRLEVSSDEKIFYNPTLIDLWIYREGETIKIKSGETLHM